MWPGWFAALHSALEPRLACKVALTNSTAARGSESAKQPSQAEPALQLIALYNVRFPVDITRFAAATLSGPIGGGQWAGLTG